MATHSSTLAWKIPWTEEPGRLQSMGSIRVRHDWVTSLSLFTLVHWRRKWQPTLAFLPGESHEQRSLVGCSLWGCKELDTTEWLHSSNIHSPIMYWKPPFCQKDHLVLQWHYCRHAMTLGDPAHHVKLLRFPSRSHRGCSRMQSLGCSNWNF